MAIHHEFKNSLQLQLQNSLQLQLYTGEFSGRMQILFLAVSCISSTKADFIDKGN